MLRFRKRTMIIAFGQVFPLKMRENCWVRLLISATLQEALVNCSAYRFPKSRLKTVSHGNLFLKSEECAAVLSIRLGQQTLFQRCYSEQGIHDFAAGYCAAGPNAFVQCDSYESFGFSGSIDAWACGLLFDVVNIDGHNLSFKNLGQDKNGAGWNTANSLFWQCTAAEIECYAPAKDAMNRAYGCWAQFSDGRMGTIKQSCATPKHFLCSIGGSFAERMQNVPYPAKEYKRHQQSDR